MYIETLIIWILLLHFIGDFILQTDKMAKGKSKSNLVLAYHVGVLTVVLFVGLCVASLIGWYTKQPMSIDLLALFGIYALANGALHFIIDWCTSRATSFLWSIGDRHNFFVVIGLDQFLHMVCYIVFTSLILAR